MPFSRAAAQVRDTDVSDWRAPKAPQSLLQSAVANSTARSYAVRQIDGQTNLAEPERPFHHPQTEITNNDTELNLNPMQDPCTPTSFKLGEIVKIPHMVQSFDDKANPAHRIEAPNFKGFICPKIRYAVIVGRYAHELLVLPIFSCNKQGVANKPEAYRTTAMSIYNPEGQSDEVRSLLLPDRLCTQGRHKFYPGSHINLANMISISYNWSIVPNQARLREQDTDLLLERFQLIQKCAYMPVKAGSAYFRKGLRDSRAKLAAATQSSRPPTVVPGSAANSTMPAKTWALTAALSAAPSRPVQGKQPK